MQSLNLYITLRMFTAAHMFLPEEEFKKVVHDLLDGWMFTLKQGFNQKFNKMDPIRVDIEKAKLEHFETLQATARSVEVYFLALHKQAQTNLPKGPEQK